MRSGDLATPDRDVARRDPELPALAVVLDPERLRDQLADRWPDGTAVPATVDVTYLRYKPRTHLVAGLTLTHADGRREPAALYGTTHLHDPKLAKVRDHAAAVDGPWRHVTDLADRWIVTPAIADRHLPAAPRLRRHAGAMVGELAGADLHPLAYKPQRRLVARLDRRGRPRAVAKVHRRKAFADITRVVRWAGTVADAHDLPLPTTLGLDDRHQVHLAAWTPGTPLDQVDAVTDDALAAVGTTLARLHRAPAAGLPAGRTAAPPLSGLAAVRPDLVADARRAVAAAARGRSRATSFATPVHGDLSADQVVVTADGIALLDVDRTHAGAPIDDLASWVAAAAIARGDHTDLTVPMALRTAYLAAGGPAPLHELDGALATALLRRATEPFRLRRPDWAERTDRLVAAALAAAERSAGR